MNTKMATSTKRTPGRYRAHKPTTISKDQRRAAAKKRKQLLRKAAEEQEAARLRKHAKRIMAQATKGRMKEGERARVKYEQDLLAKAKKIVQESEEN